MSAAASNDHAFAERGQTGLTDAEAATRLAAGQSNAFAAPASRSYLAILRGNAYPAINGPLVLISLVLAGYGLLWEAILTAAPVLFNIVIGLVQEVRAKRALDRIAILTRPTATVIRDGRALSIDLESVVLGDLVVAGRGDQLVVDGELVGDGRVELDEALLTGESDPIMRTRGDAVRSGTSVVAGEARYVATRVGAETTANRLIARSRLAPDRQTPLQREVARTIWIIAGLVVVTALIVVVAAVFADRVAGGGSSIVGHQETVEAAAVLVSLVPQGLAIMLTVTYAAGALRISRLGALVQRLRAVESMSRVDTLCIDKTGTLTTQRLSFTSLEALAPGDDHRAELDALIGSMAASFTSPDRTTVAVASALPARTRPLDDEVPFSSERRWSGLRFAGEERPLVMGAAMTVLSRVRDDGKRRHLEARVDAIAGEGQRVIVVATGPTGTTLTTTDGEPLLPDALEPIALLALTEELRPDARATLDELSRGGVTVRIISGDDPLTVDAVARRLGIDAGAPAVAGPDLTDLDDTALERMTQAVTRFGRVDPNLKGRLIAAFRHAGHYVAMIGDGVNDVLPLRAADLSVAMASGSAATRAAADLVLLGDAFGVLPRAVIEGRRILAAMQATLVLLLSRTFSVLLIVGGAALLTLPFPITPRQNAVLALLTVGAPLLLLVLWVPPMRTPPRLLQRTLRTSIPAAFALAALCLTVYTTSLGAGASVDIARTRLTSIAVFAGLGLLPLIRPPRRPPDDPLSDQLKPWGLAAISAFAYLVMTQLPFLQDLYGLAPLPIAELVELAVLATGWTFLVHGIRWLLAAAGSQTNRTASTIAG